MLMRTIKTGNWCVFSLSLSLVCYLQHHQFAPQARGKHTLDASADVVHAVACQRMQSSQTEELRTCSH